MIARTFQCVSQFLARQGHDLIQREGQWLLDKARDLQLSIGGVDLWPIVVGNVEELAVGRHPRI